MRSAARLIAVCGLLGTAIAAPALAAASTHPNPAQLSGFVCQQSQNPLNRMIEITATMRPVPGTERMAMRFQLLQALPWAAYHQIYGGDLDQWRHPNPPTFGQQPGDTWIVNKPVANLHAPARYRFRVRFKWVTWSGQVTTVRRLSAVCRQPA